MFQLKSSFSIFLICVLVQAIVSNPIDSHDSEDCASSRGGCSSIQVKSSSYVEANKKVAQASSNSSQRKETKVVSVKNYKYVPEKSDEDNHGIKQILDSLAEHEQKLLKSESEHGVHHSKKVAVNSQYQHVAEKSDEDNHNIQQILDSLAEHEQKLLKSESEHGVRNSKKVAVNSQYQHVAEKSDEGNHNIQQILDSLSRHEKKLLKSESDHDVHHSKKVEVNSQIQQSSQQSSAQSSKRQLNVVKSKYDHEQSQLNKQLTDFINHSSESDHKDYEYDEKHKTSVVHSNNGHQVHHEYSEEELFKSLVKLLQQKSYKVEHESHDVSEEVIQFLLHYLSQSSQQKTSVVKSEHGHKVQYEYSQEELLKSLVKLLQQKSHKVGHESHDVNEEVIQFLLHYLYQSSQQKTSVVKSESHELNEEVIQFLLHYLSQSSQHKQTSVVNSEYGQEAQNQYSQNELAKYLLELSKKESNDKRDQQFVESNAKLIPTVTGLVKHELHDVEGTLGKVLPALG